LRTAAQVSCKDGPTFTYDHVYGGGGEAPELLYGQCVRPLVAGLFRGYNACCFAYGQTGSGKTYTMGSSALGASSGAYQGVIPCVMRDIFERIAAAPDAEFAVRVGFVEIFNVRACLSWPAPPLFLTCLWRQHMPACRMAAPYWGLPVTSAFHMHPWCFGLASAEHGEC
jgi:hypothetical protein